MLYLAANHDDVVGLHNAAPFAHFVTQLSRFEHDNLKMIGPVQGNSGASVKNQKADIYGIGGRERPYVEALPADLPVNERIGTLPEWKALGIG
jgi:hypothetical protein